MIILGIVIAVVILSIVLCMVQAVRGATTFDRVVSIDGLTAMGVAVLALFSIYFKESIFMDIALVYAFIAFVADLAVAKSLEGRGLDE